MTVEGLTAAAQAAAILAGNVKLTGDTVQVVSSYLGTYTSGTATISGGNTIPQIGNGTQFLSATITPTKATSRLRVQVILQCGASIATGVISAAFRDSTANAIGAGYNFTPSANVPSPIAFECEVVAGSTAATTFTVRAGPTAAATLGVNGLAGAQALGGVWYSSLVVTEIAA